MVSRGESSGRAVLPREYRADLGLASRAMRPNPLPAQAPIPLGASRASTYRASGRTNSRSKTDTDRLWPARGAHGSGSGWLVRRSDGTILPPTFLRRARSTN